MAKENNFSGGGCKEVVEKGAYFGGAITVIALISLYNQLAVEVRLITSTIACLIPIAIASIPGIKILKEYKKELEAFYVANPEERPEAKRAAKNKEHEERVERLSRLTTYQMQKTMVRRGKIIGCRPTFIDAFSVIMNPKSPRAEKARANYVLLVESKQIPI